MKNVNNRIIVDLRKVQYVKFWWQTEEGLPRTLRPKKPTIYGVEVDLDELVHDSLVTSDSPKETLRERLKRRGRTVDKWIPVCVLQLTANHSLKYTGRKAVSLHREFCRRQFEKSKQQTTTK